MKNTVFALAFSAILTSCDENAIRFTEPQPTGISADQRIRKNFQGRYLNSEDSSWLVITPDRVAFQPFNFQILLDSGNHSNLEKEVNFNIQTIDSTDQVKIKIKKDNGKDSLMINAEAEDELFNIKKGGIAKFHKGYYFLNSPFEEGNGFKVRILNLTQDGIILSRIASDSVLHLLENETFVHKNSKGENDEEWRLNPTRKELKKLMNMGLFSEIKAFRKVD